MDAPRQPQVSFRPVAFPMILFTSLRHSLPLGFFALAIALSALAYVLRSSEVEARNEELMIQRATGLANFISPDLEARFGRGSIEPGDQLFGRLRTIPHLKSAFVCDDTGLILDATDPALWGRSVAETAAPAWG